MFKSTFFGIVSVFVVCNFLWTLHILNTKNYFHNKSPTNISSFIATKNHLENKITNEIVVPKKQTKTKVSVLYPYNLAFSDINSEIGRWDNQRIYKIFDFALVGEKFGKLSSESVVCLATQSSIERLYSIVQVSKHWSGPISLAVFVSDNEEFFILQNYVTYLRLCFDFINDNISFHVLVPQSTSPLNTSQKHFAYTTSFDCHSPKVTLSKMLKTRSVESLKWRLRNVYPQNHLRNLARKGCQTKYVFLTDVDIVPSENIFTHLSAFLRSTTCVKMCAFVIPTYEIDSRAKFPGDKVELLRLVKKNLARPFHENVFIYNQFATNFSRWQKDSRTDVDTFISHNVTNFEFLYEPFYVAQDDSPPHDERFLGYGFTRNSQVYEMFIAGYTFHVLSPVFTCHWGLQMKKMKPAWREKQNNINRKRFESFKREILARYAKDNSSPLTQKFKTKSCTRK